MKFGTKDKGRIPTTLIDYLLSPFQIQLEEGEWIRVASRGQRNRAQRRQYGRRWPYIYRSGCSGKVINTL